MRGGKKVVLGASVLLSLLIAILLRGSVLGISPYAKASGIAGNLSSVGSETLNNLMPLWAEGFKREYPNVRIRIQGKGSSTAPPALLQGTAQLGPMSREMKLEEIVAFERKYGYKPLPIRVGVDGIGVFVNKNNSVKCLSLEQVDAIFSKGPFCGGRSIHTWGQSGVGEPGWANQPISLYGLSSFSGTHSFFKENALCGGEYKDAVKEQPSAASVVQGVAEDRYAIGYSGTSHKASGIRLVPLSKEPGSPCIAPSSENVLNGTYPLARFLYIYVNKEPNRPLAPAVHEILKYILSQPGQEIVDKAGFIPLNTEIAQNEMAVVDCDCAQRCPTLYRQMRCLECCPE